jgi:integral membrane protein (TIGR00529 family)
MASILVMVRLKWDVGLALLAGSVILAIFTPMPPGAFGAALKVAVLSRDTLDLSLIILLIGMLGYLLKATGALDMMVDSLLSLLGDARYLLVAIPGIIGVLTVPGGAIMSAPMVGQVGAQICLSPEHKVGINIIFRHIWYFIFPMISSVILASRIAGITPESLVIFNIPVMAVGLFSAWYFLLRRIAPGGRLQFSLQGIGRLLVSCLPILVVLILYLALRVYFPLALVLGILMALVNLPPGSGPLAPRMYAGAKGRLPLLLQGIKPMMIVVVLGIMVFKETLTASSLVTTLAANLVQSGFPLWLLLLVLPLAVGLLTGAHSAAVGIVFPIFIPLLGQSNYMAGISLMFASGTLGYIISPLHLCLVLSKEFFGARLGSCYRYLVPVSGMMLAAAAAVSLLRGL